MISTIQDPTVNSIAALCRLFGSLVICLALTACGSSGGTSPDSSSSSSGGTGSSSSSGGDTSSGGGASSTSSSGGTLPPVEPSALRGYIYTRVPRTTATAVINGTRYKNLDVYDRLLETGADFSREYVAQLSGPGQLVYIDGDNNEHILFDCVTNNEPCVPLDAMVDFAGDRVLFSVYRGTLENLRLHNTDLPNRILNSSSAQIYIADLNTKQVKAIPQPAGVHDTGPIWLPDGRIMFTSTRSEHYGTVVRNEAPRHNHALQLWMMDEDGSNAVNIGPQDRDHALHPYILSSGRVIYSTWQLNHMLPFRDDNGATNGFGTLRNFFWVASVDQRGGDWASLLGAHHVYVQNDYDSSVPEPIKALHFFGERANGDICTTNYYRGNNGGAGSILCWVPEAQGVEGFGPAEVSGSDAQRKVFSPRNVYTAIPYGWAVDDTSRREGGQFLGKVRDPDGLPDGNLLLSYGRGRCFSAENDSYLFDIQGDDGACDFGIYQTNADNPGASTGLSDSPADLLKVADSPDWHEYMPRVVRPYLDIYGQLRPATPPLSSTGDNNVCQLGASSMQMHGARGGSEPNTLEIQHHSGWAFGRKEICGQQGCSMHGVNPATEITQIRFWRVKPHVRSAQLQANPQHNEIHSIIGSRVEILGDVPLQSDGSFLVQLPCDTPYVMAGVDTDGRIIARDQVVQSLRPGEKRLCQGCHVHSIDLGLNFNNRLAASAAPTVLPATGLEPEYQRDIWPMLQNNCASCHGGANPDGNLALDITGDGNGSTYNTLVWDHQGLSRPNTSRYLHSVFARESLLYWKAAGQRTDGRSDGDFGNDINFGNAHDSYLTANELKLLGDWIESGAYYEK